jgi:uncharacterized protein YfiM (DUF2279 family)
MRARALAWLASAVLAAAFLAGGLAAGAGTPHGFVWSPRDDPWWTLDKVQHLAISAALALALTGAMGTRRATWAAFAALLLGAAVEVAQTRIPGRTASIVDLAADAAGAVVALALSRGTHALQGRLAPLRAEPAVPPSERAP